MTRIAFTFAGLFLIAPSLAGADDARWVAEAAADRDASAVVVPDDAQEAQARADAAVAAARLELILARKELKARAFESAAAHARQVLKLSVAMPDVEALDGLAEDAVRLIAQARRGASVRRVEPLAPVLAGVVPPVTEPDSRQTGAQVVAGGGDHDLLIDLAPTAEIDEIRLQREAAVFDAYRADEAHRLLEADEARIAPAGELAYPPDWPERAARRQQYEGGEIARSASQRDAQGREWYSAVYDTSDLEYVAPDFQPPFGLHPAEEIRNALDREAIRWRSMIFNGYAEDLAAGIPLLQFFGGVDDYALRGPKYSVQRHEQIVEMVRQVLQNDASQPRMISLPPPNP